MEKIALRENGRGQEANRNRVGRKKVVFNWIGVIISIT
jgi:hypothetical protein